MPIIKSAKKRVRVAKKAAVRNAKTKRAFRGAIKSFEAAASQKSAKAGNALSQAQSAIDAAVKKGLLHKKTAARKKSQLAAQANAAGVKSKPAAKKTTVKKPTASAAKTTPKTAAAKKPATKKPATKKTAPKKSKK